MKKLFYLMIGAGMLLVSCAKEDSNDVNQDKIWTEYELFYNQNDDKTHAIARFRFGGPTGTLLELSDSTGASVTFDGTVMPYNSWWGAHHLEFAGNVTTGTFLYTNTNGTQYTNSVPSGAESVAFPIGFDTIVKSQSETFAWAGTAIAANQHIALFVGSWTWGDDALFYTDALGATNLVMGVNAKSNLALGTATVYMDRVVKNASINGTPEGGIIRYKYRPTNAQVEVVP
ncbi:MAG: hypothetical protein HUJ25_12155 [Crocinitomicaceae bacterium]|nr:hypothetical protein [Crocinitomicaceae bacterium]